MISLSTIAFFVIIASIIIQIYFLYAKKEKSDFITKYILSAAAILLIADTVIRSIKINFIAVTNTYEALVLFAQFILILIVIIKFKYKDKIPSYLILGGSFISFLLIALASSPLIPKEIAPVAPILKSFWLVLHVILTFIGEAFFAVAFVLSIYYLFSKDEEKKARIDRIIYISIGIGYIVFTIGALICGAIWAKSAWGHYWSWDPKEVFALVTWLVYTLYLHIRLILKRKGKLPAVISIIGFALTIFTFLGVNYLIASLHSYV